MAQLPVRNTGRANRLRQLVARAQEQVQRDGLRPTLVAGGLALLAGLFAALVAALVMLALRVTLGTPTPPELVGERILPLLSANDFVALLLRYQPHPKTTPLGLTLLGQTALGTLLGLVYHIVVRSRTRASASRWPAAGAWITAALLAIVMELVAIALFWPVLPAGLRGDPFGQARVLTILALLVTFGSFAATLALADHWLHRVLPTSATMVTDSAPPASASALTRRRVLQTTGIVVGALAASGFALSRLLSAYLARSNLAYEGNGAPAPSPSQQLTPTDRFYVVSKNVLDPEVDVATWRLELNGLVRKPLSWTYDEVRQLPQEQRAVTLECISNPVGGHIISNGAWQGVRLQTMLDLAGGALPSATHLIFYGVDGYATSLPLRDLLDAGTLLVWQLNGATLPARHGFPLRAVVPGRYGEQQAKWVTRMELADYYYKGFYQSQGWSAAPLSTMSRIDAPHGKVALGTVTVSGVAFAGTRGIRTVEVSADKGASWHTAALVPPLSPQTWVLWNWRWLPKAAGDYTVTVRATDGTGAVQIANQQGTVPDGSTGWHSVKLHVE